MLSVRDARAHFPIRCRAVGLARFHGRAMRLRTWARRPSPLQKAGISPGRDSEDPGDPDPHHCRPVIHASLQIPARKACWRRGRQPTMFIENCTLCDGSRRRLAGPCWLPSWFCPPRSASCAHCPCRLRMDQPRQLPRNLHRADPTERTKVHFAWRARMVGWPAVPRGLGAVR